MSVATDQSFWAITRRQFFKNRPSVVGLWVVVLLFVLATAAPLLATSIPFALWRDGGSLLDRFDEMDADRDGKLAPAEFTEKPLFLRIDGWSEGLDGSAEPDGFLTRDEIERWGGWRVLTPWLVGLFDKNVFPSAVDRFFNLALLFCLAFLVLVVPLKRLLRVPSTRLALWTTLPFLWCFLSMVLPESVVENRVGSVVFAPQHLLRYSKPKRDYLADRFLDIGRVTATDRLVLQEENLREATKALARVTAQLADESVQGEARANAEAIQMAGDDQLRKSKRQIQEWSDLLAEIDRREQTPGYAYQAILPPIGYHHNDNDNNLIVAPPSGGGWGTAHFLGTDGNGRDVAARILYGTRVSLTIGILAAAIYCTIGSLLGAWMGFSLGLVDIIGMRLVEIMMCFPVLAFILILVGVTGNKSIFLIMFAIGIVSWPGVARLVRGQTLVERGKDYVLAAQALGVPRHRIIFRHVLPNSINPMFVAATFGVASAILFESSLAFLGLGDLSVPSWGQILLKGRETGRLWLILSPGVAIFITVLSLNLVGEGVRDALDPKLRQ